MAQALLKGEQHRTHSLRKNTPNVIAGKPLAAAAKPSIVTKPLIAERMAQGSTILPLSLPPPKVSVRLSIVYVPPPVAPWYLPVPPVVL